MYKLKLKVPLRLLGELMVQDFIDKIRQHLVSIMLLVKRKIVTVILKHQHKSPNINKFSFILKYMAKLWKNFSSEKFVNTTREYFVSSNLVFIHFKC